MAPPSNKTWPTALEIDAVLPQTQCQECGFAACMPYAKAIAQGEANIDLCITGGEKTLRALATLTNQDAHSYLPDFEKRILSFHTASVRESECIGCTKCIQACPVDAIVGSGKFMHQIISNECTGCGLCIPPCPVDCIDLLTINHSPFEGREGYFRKRYLAREQRLQIQSEKEALAPLSEAKTQDQKKNFIQEARQRAQKKN